MEDQGRDFISHMKGALRQKQQNMELRAKKALADRDILGKALERFWNELRKVMGEICEQLSREVDISLSCKWNGEALSVTRSKSRAILNAKIGSAPPYEVIFWGENGLSYAATVRIILDDSQIDSMPVIDDAPTSARQVAQKAIEALVLHDGS
jgi:hypothetical protein